MDVPGAAGLRAAGHVGRARSWRPARNNRERGHLPGRGARRVRGAHVRLAAIHLLRRAPARAAQPLRPHARHGAQHGHRPRHLSQVYHTLVVILYFFIIYSFISMFGNVREIESRVG